MQGLIWESLLADSLVFRSQVGLHDSDPAAHLSAAVRAASRPSVTTSRRSWNNFPRGQEYGNDRQHRRQEQLRIQFQNRLEWFANSKTLGDHAIQLKDNFYAEQDIRSSPARATSVTEVNGSVPER